MAVFLAKQTRQSLVTPSLHIPRPKYPLGWLLFVLLFGFLPSVHLRAQSAYDADEVPQVERRGLDQIDQMTEMLRKAGRICTQVGIVLLLLVGLKIFNPLHLYYAAGDRALNKAIRDVDDLLKRVREDAESMRDDDPEEEAEDLGLLAGMPEIAAVTESESVPPYVLTVNDRMLDNVRVTLKRLRRFRDAGAERYKACMFSVVKGIQVVTEGSLESEAASGLAVDIHAYLKDDKRYHAWEHVLRPYARKGAYQEAAHDFMRFMDRVRRGEASPESPRENTAMQQPESPARPTPPDIPKVLDEASLPVVQKAAMREAKRLLSHIHADSFPDANTTWQCALVRRLRDPHLREDAERMLQIFLKLERETIQKLAKSKMLPCRTWDHILFMLGAADGDELHVRAGEGRLTVQEIVILEKAFLQTFAKKQSLAVIYGPTDEGNVMQELHIPQIRKESLALLRVCYETEQDALNRSTETLDREETPQRHEVMKLIKSFVAKNHDLPDHES